MSRRSRIPVSERQRREASEHESPAAESAGDADAAADLIGTQVESSDDMLGTVQQLLELSDVELATLFGVGAPAMEQWRRHGVPQKHGARLKRLHQAVLSLRSHGQEHTVAELARLPMPERAGGSILDLLAAEDIDMERVEDAVAAVQSTAASHAALEPRTRGTVGQLMEAQVVTVDAADTIREAARRMRAADIGDVIVVEHGRLQGILTDRDIVIRVVAAERDAEVTVCGQVSSPEVHRVMSSTPLPEALALMRRHALRRLPVVDGDHVSGVISLADIAVERDPESLLAGISGAPSTD